MEPWNMSKQTQWTFSWCPFETLPERPFDTYLTLSGGRGVRHRCGERGQNQYFRNATFCWHFLEILPNWHFHICRNITVTVGRPAADLSVPTRSDAMDFDCILDSCMTPATVILRPEWKSRMTGEPVWSFGMIAIYSKPAWAVRWGKPHPRRFFPFRE